MKRSKKKGPFTVLKSQYKIDKKNPIITLKRNIVITSKIIGINCQVYNGKQLCKLNVSENMLGHKLGEFVPTRSKFIFKKKKKNK